MLGKIKGKVVSGKGIGRGIGFPTLNLDYFGELCGVFAGVAKFNGNTYKAAVHIGEKPTFGLKIAGCEVYLIDFVGGVVDYSGRDLEVCVTEKIRDIRKFDSSEHLRSQIVNDVEFVKKLL